MQGKGTFLLEGMSRVNNGHLIHQNRGYSYAILLAVLLWVSTSALGATAPTEQCINLVVSYKVVNFGGLSRKAIAVNNQIPAPTLHFKQGDHVTINVYNHLDCGTTIHWHGILIPWQMDGVDHVTQRAIPPWGVFHYKFTLMQSGTYWYHAHSEAQEQDGLYGAFVIDPPQSPSYRYTKDYVVVLSDWSNCGGEKVLANLKKDGDYYSTKFPLQPSLMKFWCDYRKASCEERKNIIDDYKMMQQMRMSIYDISDVAYDAYLLNGKTKYCPWTVPVNVGDVVRLHFIGAAGSTIYRIKIPGVTMQMVHVQGNDVKPYTVNDFTIAPGETYDVLVRIEKNCPYIIYGESIDTFGKVYGALVTDPTQPIPYQQVIPFPEPKPVTRDMMDNMMSGMDHGAMDMNNSSSMMMPKRKMPMVHHDMKSMKMDEVQTMKMSGMKSKSIKESMGKMGHAKASQTSESMKMGSNMNHDMSMDHSMDMNMPTEPAIISDCICLPTKISTMMNMNHQKGMSMDQMTMRQYVLCSDMTMGTKYQDLMAAVPTNNPDKPVDGVIRMELFGYMDHFIWFINGLPEYKAKPIIIEPGKRYRIIFVNSSMMRHPMHIHGHWFILRNGHGSFDPLLHTIEVPPGATAVADIDADASGQWFFHCHHLYHMMAGMARVFQYSTIIDVAECDAKPEHQLLPLTYANRAIVREDELLPLDHSLIHHPMGHHQGFWFASFLDLGEDPFHHVQKITFKGLYGSDYNKLELFTNDAEVNYGKIENADLDIFYWHLINQFWAIKGGANYFYRPAKTPYWQPGIGIEGLMPYFIDTNIRTYYHLGSTKLDAELSRDTQITNNFFVKTGIRGILATKTVTEDEVGNGLNLMRYIVRPYYRVAPGFNIFMEYEHEHDYGAFKTIQYREGSPTSEDTVTFGVAFLF